MKAKLISGLFLAVLSTLFTSFGLAQNCAKQTFCDPTAYGEFDYKSQTRSAILSPGDTVRTTVVIYSDQLTRILLCGDTKLGAIKFKLFEPVKEIKRYVKQVNKKEEWIEEAQKDENGNPIKDDWGEPLIEEKLITKSDTIWGRKLLIKEREVFDSQKNSTGKSYWQQEAKKSKRLVIEAIIPKGDPDISGCVNVRVGYKMKKKKQFTFE